MILQRLDCWEELESHQSWLSLQQLLDHRALVFSLLFIFQCCCSFLNLFICDPLFSSLCSHRYPVAQHTDLDSRLSLMWEMWPLVLQMPPHAASLILSESRLHPRGEPVINPIQPPQSSPDPPPPPPQLAPAAVSVPKHMMYHNTNPPHVGPSPPSHPNMHVWVRTNDAIDCFNI